MAEKCKECGCKCIRCGSGNSQHNDMHLHAEIENLHQRLLERDNHIVTMETQFLNEADKFPNGELATIKEEILTWQEKYSRLYEAHKRVQKVNQNLEDKLLKIVDKCETEKSAFTKDIATLSHRLADANYTIHRLTQDNEKYRNDVNLAIQLLQCKPSNFIGQKYDSLPSEVQAKVRTYVAQKQCPSEITPDIKSITVPISTFPPTAMVYNVTKPPIDKHSDDDSDDSKPPVDIVSAAIMAKVLQDRERDRIFAKHCDTCACHKSILMVDAETQTTNSLSSLCCNECTTKCAHHGEKQADNIHLDKKSHSKDNQNSVVSCVFQETNENVSNGSSEKVRFYHNNNCTKHTNCQFLCTKGKVIRNARSLEPSKEDSRTINVKSNLHKKNSIHHNDVSAQNTSHNFSRSITRQKILQNLNDIPINRASNDKIKQAKISNKSDSHLDLKSNDNSWNKLDKKSTACNNICENTEKCLSGKEQTQIDIINDRLWKNEWTKLRTQTNFKSNMNRKRDNSDIEIDVINDRDWRKDHTGSDTPNPTQFTLIEVKSVDNVTSQTDCTQTEVTISPSYSTDSIIISTSDPSSSASDVVNSVTGTKLKHNISNVKSNGQRFSGPRNCFVRVAPGSKNILLDNAGHYKTVLYTSGSNKPNTALVHSKKMSRSGSERSASTNSEDSSLVLLHDNNHLQRVAEWVQSSVCMETVESDDSKISKFSENNINQIPNSSVSYVNEKKSKFKMHSGEGDVYCSDAGNKHDIMEGHKESCNENSLSSDVSTLPYCSDTLDTMQYKEKDLITFDVPLESENQAQNVHKSDTANINYEVKVTKEMEETYLKLAASLDPVALSLSTSKSMDLTIERYRKDYKKLHIQRCQDKMGSKTSGSS